MWRTALSLLLIGTTLFGQSVCCCTFRAFALSIMTDGQPADSCCCSQSGSSDEQCPDQSNDPGHQCPCKKDKAVAAKLGSDPILPTMPSFDWSRLFPPVEQLGFVSHAEVAALRGTNHCSSSAFPRLDGVGILRAVCSLRC